MHQPSHTFARITSRLVRIGGANRATLVLAAGVLFATVPTVPAHAQHPVLEEDFSDGVEGWTGSGDFFWDALSGHLTPNGSARNMDSGGHTIFSPCIRVDDEAVDWPQFSFGFSVRASVDGHFNSSTASYRDPECTDPESLFSQNAFLPAGQFIRFTGTGWPTSHNARSIRTAIVVTPTSPGFFSTLVDDYVLTFDGPDELLQNARFHDDTAGWLHWWGDSMSHNPLDGHLSALGSAEVDGSTSGYAGIGSACLDWTAQPYPEEGFHTAASIKPPGNATEPIAAIYVDSFGAPNCQSPLGRQSFGFEAIAGEWSRHHVDFEPLAGARSVRVIAAAIGVPNGGTTLIDDLTLYSTYSTTIFIDGFEDGLGNWTLSTP